MQLRVLHIFFVILLMILCPRLLPGQNAITHKPVVPRHFVKTVPDTNFVKTYKGKLLLGMIATRKFQQINLYQETGPGKLQYLPNNPFNFGVGFTYNWISLDLAYMTPWLTRNYDQKGRTDLYRIRVGYNKPRVWINTFIQYCKGWYLKNTDALDPQWFDKHYEYPLRPDVTNMSWFLSLYYSFNNEKITYQSSLGLEQRQKKSAGTFLLGSSVFTNYISADSSMIPSAITPAYAEELDFREQVNVNYGLNFGYVHTFLITRYLFFTLALYPGIHFQSAYNSSGPELRNHIGGDFGTVTESRAVLGYNTDDFYGGLSLTQVSIAGFPSNSVITNGYAHLKVFAGKRFNMDRKKHNKRKS